MPLYIYKYKEKIYLHINSFLYIILNMNIGDLVLIRNGGAYGLFDLNDSNGDVLKTSTAGIVIDKVPVKHRKGNCAYYTVYCKICIENELYWIPEGMLQKPSNKLLWGYIKKYSKQPKVSFTR